MLKNKLRILLIFLLLGFVFKPFLYSQNLIMHGNVKDSITMQPVPFATLFVNNVTGTISDEHGNFTLSLMPGLQDDTLKITSIGYTSKSLPLHDIMDKRTIYLAKNIYELESVVVEAKPQKIQKPEDIIQKAVDKISENYPDKRTVYKGYYREYVKDGGEFVNLFESILNLEDLGIGISDKIRANLDYKRLNNSFRVDTALFRSYDNEEKFVPYAKVHVVHQNELAILESTDPIKHENGFSVSFIDNFRTDFLKNHTFEKTRITYQDNVPFFVIDFEDNQGFILENERLKTTGTIFIDAETYAIKKINYLATLISGVKPKKLYELSLEYQKSGDKFYMKYISFNNLFKNEAFVMSDASYDEKGLIFIFNNPLDSLAVKNISNFRVYYKNTLQTVNSVKVKKNILFIDFDENSALAEDLRALASVSLFQRKKDIDILRDVNIEFKDIQDVYGNALSKRNYNEYYQYREYFVNEIDTSHSGLQSQLLDMSKPVFDSKAIYPGKDELTSYFNTPLIHEDTKPLVFTSQNSGFNKFLNQVTRIKENRPEEIVYMHADREVYAPQDTVWFKGYIRNKSNLAKSYLSRMFYAELVDSKGEPVWDDKFLIQEGDVSGQFAIPDELAEGKYHFFGYSSWMKNYKPDKIFHKQILVQKDKPDKLRMGVTFDRKEYLPDDSVSIQISCIDEYNRKMSGVTFEITIKDANRIIFIREGKTNSQTLSTYSFLLPKGLTDMPHVELKGKFKDARMNKQLHVPVNYFVHVDFFPEGGHILEGIKSTMAFKSVTRHGYPLSIEGEIVNHKGRVQQRISSAHEGMGSFTIRYSNEDSLYLHITKPEVFMGKRFPLPKVHATGWQLQVKSRKEHLLVEIDNFGVSTDTSLVTVMVRDELVHYKPVLTDRDFRFFIPKANIPDGIAVITLFNDDLIPQAERLIFLHDTEKYQAEMQTDRKSYRPRDSVTLSVKLSKYITNPEKGSWSVSIVDEPLCMTGQLDEPNITSKWLISTEIGKNIHELNSYLYHSDKKATENIDLLMMTTGWRNYNQYMTASDEIPENQDVISGKLYKQPFGQEAKPSKGELTIYFGGQTNKLNVNEDGRFSFLPDYKPEHNTGIFISASDENEKSQINIELDRHKFEEQLEKYVRSLTADLSENGVSPLFTYNQFREHFTYDLQYHEWIDEVVIRKKVEEKPLTIADLATTKRTVPLEEVQSFHSLEEIREYYSYYFNNSENVFYVIDGRLQASSEFVSQMNPNTGEVITTTHLVPDNSYVQGIFPEDIAEYTMVKGYDVTLYGLGDLGDNEYTRMLQNENKAVVIDIKLKPLNERKTHRLWENTVVIPAFAVAKEFYKPIYDTGEKRNSQIPDLRKTIHWEPDVTFNRNGTATITFYNGDRYTRVSCILQGIDDRGVPVYGEYRYSVNLER